MDSQRRTNTLFQERVKDDNATKSNPCAHVLSCSATFNDLLCRGLCKKESQSLNNY